MVAQIVSVKSHPIGETRSLSAITVVVSLRAGHDIDTLKNVV